MSDQVTPEMFHHWLIHPVTQKFMEDLREYRQRNVEVATDCERPCDIEGTAKLKGTIYGLDLAIGWKAE